MEEQELIQKLNSVEDIKPLNASFEDNLKKRLINQRQAQIAAKNANINTSAKAPEKKFMFGLPLFLGFSFIIVVLVGSIVYFSVPSFHNNNNSNNSADNKNEDGKKPQLNIGGEMVLASDYELEGFWVKLRLPADWKFQNTSYDVDKLEDAQFVNGDKTLTITNGLQNYSSQTSNNTNLDSIKNSSSPVKAIKVDNSELEKVNGKAAYDNNYLVKVENAGPMVLFSAKNEQDLNYLQAIVNDMSTIDPYRNWKDYNSNDLGIKFKYSDNWSVNNSSDNKNIWLSKSVSSQNENYEILVNINHKTEEYSGISFTDKLIYGKKFKYAFDEEKQRMVYPFINKFGEELFTEVVIKDKKDEASVSKSTFDKVFAENGKDIKLLINSLEFVYGDFEERVLKTEKFLYPAIYVQNEVNNLGEGIENINLVNGTNSINIIMFATSEQKMEYLNKNYEINTESKTILGKDINVANVNLDFEKSGYMSVEIGGYHLAIEFKGDQTNLEQAEKVLKSLIISIENK